MIKVLNGLVAVKGNTFELVQDFNCIIDELMEINPEIFMGASASWADIVLNKLPKCNQEHLTIVQALSDTYIKLNVKEKADNE